MTFYNEIDRFAAAWLHELIALKQLPDGVVDERSITAVEPSDLDGYAHVALFAGIDGWELALRLAGWGGRQVWTSGGRLNPVLPRWLMGFPIEWSAAADAASLKVTATR